MRPGRPRSSFMRYVVIPNKNREVLSTARSVPSEIFAALSYLSEVPEAGKEMIRKRNPERQEVDAAFALIRAFIRQAKTFWDAAQPLHHRAGPLNYYYCFLNLAKAYIALTEPQAVSGRLMHGLTAGDPPKEFSEATISIQQGVFPLFFKKCFGIQWPQQLRINVLSALAYCGDVGHEYQTAGFGTSVKRLLGMFRLELHEKQAFGTLGLVRYNLLTQYPRAKERLEGAYEVVQIPSNVIEREFGLLNQDARLFTFLESRKTFPFEEEKVPAEKVCGDCYAAVKDQYLPLPYDVGNFEFSLYPPYSEEPYAPFNEVMAIYVVMFYLSSLVRYHPFYLEEMLESKEAWLIETFALSAPHTFLRHMVNLILDEERVYKAL